MLQCVAVCYSRLQCVIVLGGCWMLQCVAEYCNISQCAAVRRTSG